MCSTLLFNLKKNHEFTHTFVRALRAVLDMFQTTIPNFTGLLRAGHGTAITHFTHSSRDHCLLTHHFYAGDKKKVSLLQSSAKTPILTSQRAAP